MQIKKLIFTAIDMSTHSYIVESPVLLLVFNRPDATKIIFEAIRKAKPARLYLSADGPRPGNASDEQLCNEVRSIIAAADWPCRIKTLFNNENKGCKMAVSEAIQWFFDQEEEGIILEDDCIPAPDFFYFCDQMLVKYRNNDRIFSITGSNMQKGILRGEASYYFSRLNSIWGWASWRRVWQHYDRELSRYSLGDARNCLEHYFSDPILVNEWLDIFDRLKANKIDTWDQQFQFIGFFENGLCITPNVNLISNIGFGEQATHTKNPKDPSAGQAVGEMGNIRHPAGISPDGEADYFLFNQEFKLDEKHRKTEKDKLLRRRVKKWFKELFNFSNP